MQSVRDGDYNSINDALIAFSSNAAPSLATAIPGFKGVKAMKTKPSELQMNLDTDAKSPTPETAIVPKAEVAPVTEQPIS